MSLSLSGTTNVQEVKYKRTQTTNLLEYAEENRHCGMFNDITITIGDDTFPANRMVLSCYSHFFETMFKTEMKEKYQDSVEIENIDGNSMKNLILFIYTGNININSENVCNLLSASDYLQIEDVKKFCFEFLASAITSENCFIILALADRYRNDELTNQVKKFMADNFEKVLCSGGFQKLTKKEMTTCISKLDRDTVRETTIYKAIIEWTNHDLDGRECDFPEHFKLIDLHKLPSDFLHETVSNEKLVIDNLTCSKMLIPVLTKRWKFGNTTSEECASSIDEKTYTTSGGRAHCSIMNPDEHKIFNTKGIIEWTNHDLDGRECDFPEHFKLTDLHKLPSDFLHETVSNEKLVIDNLTCSKMLIPVLTKRWKFDNTTSEECASSIDGKTYTTTGGRAHCSIMNPDEHKIFNTKDQQTSLLCLGGWLTQSKVIEVYNISNERKKEYPDLPVGRHSACSISLHDYVYFIGGTTDSWVDATNLVSRMNLTEDVQTTWEQLPAMNLKRCLMGATVLNDTIVVMGGYDGRNILSTGECFNPITKSWQNVSSMRYARRCHALVACKGSIYAIGGYNRNYLSSVERCHPPSASWDKIKSLKTPRSSLVAVNCDDVIYAIGGSSGNGALKSSEKYDFDNNQWTYVSDMKFARSGLSACVMQGKIYVVGGRDGNNKYVRAIECYDPSTNEWSNVGEVDIDLWRHSIVAV